MAKESKVKSHITDRVTAKLEGEATSPTPEDRGSLVWVREDGAICVGDECIVIKRETGTKNLDIDIAPTKCGEATGEMLLEHLLKTVGRGGNTRFTVKSDLVDEESK
jgi:hypothetical protein